METHEATQIKEWLKNYLEVRIKETIEFGPVTKISVELYLEDKKISEDYFTIPEKD